MIERLLETWLNKANERSFQIPFCHWLAYTGHTVVHMSRHCAMEMGKDILAIDPQGVPCAYQLKGVDGGRMTIGEWRRELGQQIHPLVSERIVHPSITSPQHHRSFIVINGDFDEEVHRAIDDFNQTNARSGYPERKVETIVKGQLFQAFKELQADFWATNLHNLRSYLELLTEDGCGQLPKAKLCSLFESALPFEAKVEKGRKKKRTVGECTRAFAGCAIICASAISQYTGQSNHLAEFEAWTLFFSYTLALTEKWKLPLSKVKFALDVAQEAIYSSLGRLCDELMKREVYVQGTALTLLADAAVYRVRITHLLGLMGIYGFWRMSLIRDGKETVDEARDAFLRKFCAEKSKLIWLWGEYAIPQILALNFFASRFTPQRETEGRYFSLIHGITRQNHPKSEHALANPYYDPEMILPHLLGLEGKPLEDSFAGSSYYLEGLMHLAVRTNYKQSMKMVFPEITRIGFHSYVPEEPWQFFLLSNRGKGTSHTRFLKPPHKWEKLRTEAEECEGKDIPAIMKRFPLLYSCLLMVMPHRVSASGLRWLATEMDKG